MRILLFLAACLPLSAHALTYNLSGLRYDSSSQRQTAAGFRHYIKFQSAQANHVLIYDEENAHPPSRDIAALRQVMIAADAECSLNLTCTAKAFCTGDCRNMYYELSNAGEVVINAAQPAAVNRCMLTSFSCARKAKGNP